MAKDSVKEKLVIEGIVDGFVNVNKPQTRFDETGAYSINVSVDEKDGKMIETKMKKILDEQFAKFRKNNKKAEITACVPHIRVEKDETGRIIKETPVEGKYLIKAKNKAYIKDGKIGKKIQVFDSKLKPVDIDFGAGSRVKVGLTLEGYSSNLGTGVSVKLHAVQLLEVQNNNGYSAEDFFTVEDGFEADEVMTSASSVDETEEEDF